jgi:uridine phosphorylase
MAKIRRVRFSRVAIGSAAVPVRLRPTAPIAADAVLVGDPGRALLLAQELLEEPKMSNHARGLWGYWGRTPSGDELTIQSTGMGGPSAGLVLGDLAKLGVRRAVRVGTCVGLGNAHELGDLLLVIEAVAEGGSAASRDVGAGETVRPNAALTERLGEELGESGRATTVVSLDAHPGEQTPLSDAGAADMQTAPLLARARSLGIEATAVLIVAEKLADESALDKDALESAEKRAGGVAAAVLSG